VWCTWRLHSAEKFARESRRRERFYSKGIYVLYISVYNTRAQRVFIIIAMIIIMIVIVIAVYAAIVRGRGSRARRRRRF